MRKSFWTVISLITLFVVAVVVLPKIVHGALLAPSLVITGGDDKFGDGGNNDPYDSLVILEVHNDNAKFDHYVFNFSYDGISWYGFSPQYKEMIAQEGGYVGHRQYYWSTSNVSNGPVYLRVAYVDVGSNQSDYATDQINIKHETGGRRGSYFVEDFTSGLWNDTYNSTNVTWPADASVRLSSGSSGTAYSSNLATSNGGVVLSIAIQPVQSDYGDQNIKFQVSNNGTDWYGTSGVNSFINFSGPTPNGVTINLPANDANDNKVIWRAIFSNSSSSVFPEIFKIRLQWEVNGPPIPCFSFSPIVSSNPNETYYFNAGCSTDFNAGSGLSYAWSWDNGSTTSAYNASASASHVFATTSPQTVILLAKDSYGSVASTSDIVNIPGVQDGIYGWSWNINYGWTSLNCDNIYYGESIDLCGNSTYKVLMNADRTLSGWAWNSNFGWMCFGRTCTGVAPDGNAPNATYNMVNGYINGWARYVQSSDLTKGWMKLRGEKWNGTTWCGTEGKACTYLNFAINGISGWAWGGQSDGTGPGWENFLGSINAPWFETKFSSIYGLKKLGSQSQFGAPTGKYSATYCIWADDKSDSGTITNLTSEYSCIKPGYKSNIKFPSVDNKYSTIGGLLNIQDMILLATKAGTVYNTDNVGMILDASRPLGGKVYYFTGKDDYTIDQSLTFFNGRSKTGNAAGTIIVDGNLHIKNSLRYENSAVQYSSKNLASVAFIVKGDIIIDSGVDVVSGVFVVLGSEKIGQNCEGNEDGCGKFLTGDDSSSPRKLNINGMVMARKFFLQRTYKQNSAAAETFNYDGRVSINTPPGLSNVAGGLPTWREVLAGSN